MATEKQVRYSDLVLKKQRSSIVTKVGVIVNDWYEGDPKAGAVKIPTRGEASVGDYNPATGVGLDAVTTGYTTLVIDKDIYVNELIDGYADSATVPDDIIADRLDSAGYGIAKKEDRDTIAKLIADGTASTNTEAPTAETAYDEVVDARTALSKAKTPTEDRWLLVNPDFYSLLLKDDNFIRQGDISQTLKENGAIGQVAGFGVYETSDLDENTPFIAGHYSAVTRADEFEVEPQVVSLTQSGRFIGASAVQTRKVFGVGVTNPECIYVKKVIA